MILRPLSIIADVLPVFGSIIEDGTYLVAGLSSFILSLTSIAISWVAFRPIVGVPLLFIAAAFVWLLKTRITSSKGDAEDKTDSIDDN